MEPIKHFSNKDVIQYYEQTEVHYRMFWQLEKSRGLHYGIWDKGIRRVSDAVWNTNQRLAQLGQIENGMEVLDAGCGIGGSSLFLAKEYSCKVNGITLSSKQVDSAQRMATQNDLSGLLQFSQQDYTQTSFPNQSFDIIWAIESMETAKDKTAFFKEAARLLKPGGKLLIADIFKPQDYDIADEPRMQKFLNAWAMSDILSVNELEKLAQNNGFSLSAHENVNQAIWPSVWRLFIAGCMGFIGTKAYNVYKKASYFSRIHYTSGINQYRTYRRKLWEYHLWCFQKA